MTRWGLLGTVLVVQVACGGWAQYAAAERPEVGTVCCPDSRTYLQQPQITTALMSFPGSGNTWVRWVQLLLQ